MKVIPTLGGMPTARAEVAGGGAFILVEAEVIDLPEALALTLLRQGTAKKAGDAGESRTRMPAGKRSTKED